MASGKWRKSLVALGILVIGVLFLIFAAPLWVPWLLKPVLARHDVHFTSFERNGYERLKLKDVSHRSTNITFRADSIELFQPSVWLLRHWSGHFTSEDLRVENWHLTIHAPPRPPKKKPFSIHNNLQQLDQLLADITPWLETAYLKNGELVIQDQQTLIPQLIWNRGSATASLTTTNTIQSAVVSAHLQREIKQLNINVSSPFPLEADLKVQTRQDDVALNGEIYWRTNSAELAALFGPQDIRPRTASLRSIGFRVPASLLRLEGYEDLTGSFSAEWKTNSYSLALDALASPRDETNLPPVEAIIHARGTTNFIRIEQASLSTPWISAQISTNVVFSYTGELLSPEAALRVMVDLDKQVLIDATGRFVGNAFLQRSGKQYPHAQFTLSSENFRGFNVRLEEINVNGELDWPWVTVDSARVAFSDGAVANLTSRYNAVGRFFDSGTIQLNGQIGHEFLPPELSYTNIALTGKFTGSLTHPIHSGKLEISGLIHEAFGPTRVAAEWHGKLLEFDAVSAELETRGTTLQFAGSGAVSTNQIDLLLTNALLQQGDATFLKLQHPAKVLVKKTDHLEMHFDQLAFQAEDRELFVDGNIRWPAEGSVNISAQNISSRWFERFLQKDLHDVFLKNLQLQAAWTNGPVQFEARSNARFASNETNAFVVRFDARSDPEGTVVEHLDLLSDAGLVLSGEGRLPLTIQPADTNKMIHLRRTDPIDFRAHTVPNTAVWEQIAKLTNLRLGDPELNLNISGSLENPKGEMQLQAKQTKWLGTNAHRIPAMENIRANIHFAEQKIRVSEMSMTVVGQPISLQAELPIDDDYSQPWRKLLDWRQASGRLQVQDAKVSAFEKYLPEIFVPQGTVSADIAFSPGPQFTGALILNNAATRPLPNSAPLQNIQARLRFVQQQIEFEEVRALFGGQPVDFFGRIDFGTDKHGKLPLLDLYLRGENVPMARRTDLVLRSDLNLRLSNLTNDIPRISGNVRLRDSFYLGDLRQLIPGRVASPKRRPPYFNVEVEPFSDWQVDVLVTGNNFLRARSPIFRGSVSANLRVSGPLKEPIVLGDVPIENGTILFPFANFQVEQGFVTLTSENPYQPQLFVNARSRAFGYDIETSLTGPANNPIIEFTSTPPLNSEQIILMVTAGEMPRQGFGFSDEQRAQRLALFVGKSVLSRFTDGGGAERLTITTGAEISEQGRETYALEYKINDDWSIVGEYDRFGALNVGMKWRIYSR